MTDEHRKAQYRAASAKRRAARKAAGLPSDSGPSGKAKPETYARLSREYRARKKAEKSDKPVDAL